MAGAGYALGAHPRAMRRRVLEFARSDLAQDSRIRALVHEEKEISWQSLVGRVNRLLCQGRMVKSLFMDDSVLERDYMRRVVEFFLPETEIESLPIPFAATAVDLLSGQLVVLDSGSLREAVLASCSIPGVSPPVEIDGRHLADGGVICLVPVEVARKKWAAPVLGVRVDRNIKVEQLPEQALEYVLRASDIQMVRMGEMMLAEADLGLYPKVGEFHWAEFVQARRIMNMGFEAAREAWPRIAELTRPRSWFSFLRRARR
jgi:NTE family protein